MAQSKALKNLKRRVKSANERGASIAPLPLKPTRSEISKASAGVRSFKAQEKLATQKKNLSNKIKFYNETRVLKQSGLLNVKHALAQANKKELKEIKRVVDRLYKARTVKERQEIYAKEHKKELKKYPKTTQAPLLSGIENRARDRLRRKQEQGIPIKIKGHWHTNILRLEEENYFTNWLRGAIKTGNKELYSRLKRGGLEYALRLEAAGYEIKEVYLEFDAESGATWRSFDPLELTNEEVLDYRFKKGHFDNEEAKEISGYFPTSQSLKKMGF